MFFKKLYVRIWLAVVLAVAVATFSVGWISRNLSEPRIRDVVVPEVGTRVPAADPAALAVALEKMLRADAATWQRISEAARARAVEVYDWDKIAARFVAIYEGMIAQSRETLC